MMVVAMMMILVLLNIEQGEQSEQGEQGGCRESTSRNTRRPKSQRRPGPMFDACKYQATCMFIEHCSTGYHPFNVFRSLQ